MRILFVVRNQLSWRGGAMSTTHHLARELIGRGHEVRVLNYDDVPDDHDDVVGYPVISRPRADVVREPLPAEPTADVVVVAALNRERDPWTRSAIDAAGAIPVVLYVHDLGGVELASQLGPALRGVAAVSDFVSEAIRARGGTATTVLPLVPRALYRAPTSREVALFVNPIPQKGLELVLDLARRRPDVRFAFARAWRLEPADLERLEAGARGLGNVEIRPPTPDPAVLYGDARVLLVPSIYPEAWGRVVVEAHASGIPAIVSGAGGLPEALRDGGIAIAPQAGPQAWLDAFARLCDDEDEYGRYAALAERNGERAQAGLATQVDRFEALLAGV